MAAGKWMEDTCLYFLPKDFTTAEYAAIQNNGILIGSEFDATLRGGINVIAHNIEKDPDLRTRDFLYKLA